MKTTPLLALLILMGAPAATAATLNVTSGLDVWFDASDIDGSGNSTLTDGQTITTWVNKGTTGANNGTFIEGTRTLDLDGGDGGQAMIGISNVRLRFSGAGTEEWGDSAAITAYFVVNRSAQSGAEGVLLNDYGATNTGQLRLLRTGGGSLGGYTRDSGGDSISVSPSSTLADQSWATVFYSFDPTVGTGTVTYGELGNLTTGTNANYDSTTTFDGTAGGAGPLTLFSFWDGNNSNDFNGAVSEVLIYDRVLSASEQADVESYLAAKAVPEPSALALLLPALGGLCLRRRR